jgi:hypothetical protein
MENNKGTGGAETGFGFVKKPSTETPDNGSRPVEETSSEEKKVEAGKEQEKVTVQQKIDENLNKEYTEHKSITIALVKNYSFYRRANDKVMTKRRDFIGSSVSSSRVLSSNKEEVEAYFPRLVGLSPNNDNFMNRVKQYLNNIQVAVDELGKTFDCSFHYNHYSDYLAIKKKEEKIESNYKLANKSNNKDLRAALKEKLTLLNELETSKHKLGYPLNLEDYILYRHCLLYNDIAKDTALINSDASIRFYFKDNNKEAELQKKLRTEINNAKANYVNVVSDPDMFDAVYIQYCVISGRPIVSSMLEDRITKENQLDRFSIEDPIKFNKICRDNDIKLKALIETLIARGEFIRAQHNQNILTPEGDFIGANMKEAVAWFKDSANSAMVAGYKNKLKLI